MGLNIFLQIATELLDLNWKRYQTKTTKYVMSKADAFGLVLLIDLATMKGCHLINIIASLFNVPMAVLGVKCCSEHLAQGRKKNANFILESIKPHLKQYDDNKSRTDLVFFDCASNVQKVGQILAAYYPRITLLHSAKHELSLFSLTLQNYQLSG